MRWWLIFASLLLLGTTVPANPPGEDFSDPELVTMYIWLECEALEYSYEVMRHDLGNISKRYIKCISIQDNNPLGNPWYGLQCVYVKQTFDFRYTHIMSVEKAYNLMCTEDGRKEERYEIDYPPKD